MNFSRFRTDRYGNTTEEIIPMTQEEEDNHNQRERIKQFMQADDSSITLIQLVRAFKAFLRRENGI